MNISWNMKLLSASIKNFHKAQILPSKRYQNKINRQKTNIKFSRPYQSNILPGILLKFSRQKETMAANEIKAVTANAIC